MSQQTLILIILCLTVQLRAEPVLACFSLISRQRLLSTTSLFTQYNVGDTGGDQCYKCLQHHVKGPAKKTHVLKYRAVQKVPKKALNNGK